MRHKKEHHEMHPKTRKMLEKHGKNLEKMITENKRALGHVTGGELKGKPETARRVGDGVRSEEPMREKRKYVHRK